MRRGNRFWRNESGAEIVEWIVVTMILIVAFFAILQTVGDELVTLFASARQWVMELFVR
jgi:Flp pilus assembly pilin Flp